MFFCLIIKKNGEIPREMVKITSKNSHESTPYAQTITAIAFYFYRTADERVSYILIELLAGCIIQIQILESQIVFVALGVAVVFGGL